MPIAEILMQLLPALASGVGSYMGNRGQQPQGPLGPQGQFGGGQQPQGQFGGGNPSDITSQMGPGGERFSTFNTFNPDQQQLQQLLTGQLGPLLQGLMGQGQEGGGARAQEARARFEEQTIPSIAERFTGMGRGAQSTEAFKRALGSAGSGLERGIAADQEGMLMQILPMLLSQGMTSQRESFVTPAKPSSFESLLGGLGQGIGTYGPIIASKYLDSKFGGSGSKDLPKE